MTQEIMNSGISGKDGRVGPGSSFVVGPTRMTGRVRGAIAFVFLCAALAVLAGRKPIPPLVESDYCYQLLAADRWHSGLGPTTPPPAAPLQPWEWRADWAYLTQWPIGYSVVLGAVRWMIGMSTLEACRTISVIACGAGLVGWYFWLRRMLPRGVTAAGLCATAAASVVSPASLINPSSDALVVAILPFVLQMACAADRRAGAERGGRTLGDGTRLLTAGVFAGALFWIRYAAIFVPAAILLWVLVDPSRSRRSSIRRTSAFAAGSAIPVSALLLWNSINALEASVAAQMNLGAASEWRFSPSLLAEAWWNFTQLGYYAHRPDTGRLFAVWPAIVLIATCISLRLRSRMVEFIATPEVRLSICCVVSLLGLLVVSSTLFQGKFNYVGLDRYYLPVRPLYFVLFVSPLLLVQRAPARLLLALGLVAAASWTVQEAWAKPLTRWTAAKREATAYGQWARAFQPGAGELYQWLKEKDSPELIVVSNFHEYVALETGIPALPIPPDRAALREWIERIHRARKVERSRILFVLHSNYLGREYWIKPFDEIVRTFQLGDDGKTLEIGSTRVFPYTPEGAPGT